MPISGDVQEHPSENPSAPSAESVETKPEPSGGIEAPPANAAAAPNNSWNVPGDWNLIELDDRVLISKDKIDELTTASNSMYLPFLTLAAGVLFPTGLSLLTNQITGPAVSWYVGAGFASLFVAMLCLEGWRRDARRNTRTRDESKKTKISAWTMIGVPKLAAPPISGMASSQPQVKP